MKQAISFLIMFFSIFHTRAQNKNELFPIYTGNDLGLTYSPRKSAFKIWAPTATKAEIKIYAAALEGEAIQTIDMSKGQHGCWTAVIANDQQGRYYTFRIEYNGQWLDEVPDPYAKAVGTNGARAMIVDLQKTNPADWGKDRSPVVKNPTDAVIYELHIRDASIDHSSGILHKGKFIGLTETGTKNDHGLSTGLDHLIELGVTHIHLLPFFDYHSIDELHPEKRQYNWGYDPLNYNAPEGSYASSTADGSIRIRELKTMIAAFHKKGLGVIMDVVYNHTGLSDKSNFNQLVPGYYYRHTASGKLSNATGCGNETASEQPMMRKFMLESVLYWAKDYHIDGFRFDLMGVHDITTMDLISKELHKINPGILIYGEGWTAGQSTLPDSLRALKKNVSKLHGIAVFSDDIRDAIKGSVFDGLATGFVSGKTGLEESIKFGIAAACQHPQIDYSKVNYSKAPYAASPGNTVTYAECHDNNTLWDKLAISTATADVAMRKEMQKLALSIVLTSQGISFLHAGTEFLRTKKGIENSYNSPDSINGIDWNLKTINNDVFDYVKQLIAMRKSHPAFRMQTALEVRNNIRFFDTSPGLVGYEINGSSMKDRWKKIQVWFNGGDMAKSVSVPGGKGWISAILNNHFQNTPISGTLQLQPHSCTLIYIQ